MTFNRVYLLKDNRQAISLQGFQFLEEVGLKKRHIHKAFNFQKKSSSFFLVLLIGILFLSAFTTQAQNAPIANPLPPIGVAQNLPNANSQPPTGSAQKVQVQDYPSGIKVNFVRTTELKTPITTEAGILPTDKNKTTVSTQYMDGIGRPIEQVAHFGSPTGKDLVDVTQYDAVGRVTAKFLPFSKAEATVADNGKFKLNAYTAQNTFYQTTMGYSTENYFYTKSIFEASPLNRVQKVMAQGNTWVGNNKGQNATEAPLTATESIRVWNILFAQTSLPTSTATYPAASLMVKTQVDEDGNLVEQFVDKSGQLILTRTGKQGIAKKLLTYYVYDDFGLLRCVIPPKAVTWLAANNWALNTAIVSELCFTNVYDSRHRLIIKHTPGAGDTYLVYNIKDQVILTQSPEQRLTSIWSFAKYDLLNRPIQSGEYIKNVTLTTLQATINTGGTYGGDVFLQYLMNPIYGTANYLTSFAAAKILITNYYDDYTFTTQTYNTSFTSQLPAGFNSVLATQTKGLLTGTKIAVLNPTTETTTTQLVSVMYYNNRGLVLQTQNLTHKGDWNIYTNSYDFTGKLLGSLASIKNATATDNTAITILKKYTYDHSGRLLVLSHKINAEAEVPIASYTYDELGRVKYKVLGNAAEILDYSYNIRNWLTGINKAYCLNKSGNSFFGMELSYDYGYTTNYTNGTIAGMKWRNAGKADDLRSYGYTYDDYGRLKTGDFVYKNSKFSWNNTTLDYSATNMSYDDNGNLQSMKQMGDLGGQKIILDDMQYGYMANSNKLLSVTESAASQSIDPAEHDDLGDFRDVPGATDYVYNTVGNLKSDANKSFAYTYHSFIDKATNVVWTGNTNSVQYVYDALGNKLQKKISNPGRGGTEIIVEDYIGEVTYKNKALAIIMHDEGHIRPNNAAASQYAYDYFIKDHLGNVRTVVTEELVDGSPNIAAQQPVTTLATTTPTTTNATSPSVSTKGNLKQYVATSELANTAVETQIFDNIEKTRSTKALASKPNDTKSAKVNGSTNMIGPDITLKVMARDKVKIKVEALFVPETGSNTQQVVQNVAANFLNAYNGLSTIANTEGGITAANTLASNSANGAVADAILQMQNNAPNDGQPKAFLNYILLDQNLKLIPGSSGAINIKNLTTWQTLETDTIPIPQNGYLRVFSSNVSAATMQFDNLTLQHWQGKLVEEFNYYPYGLMFDHTQALLTTSNNNLFNGKELQHNEFGYNNGLEVYDYGARLYEPQIGRWSAQDPMTDAFHWQSPYCAMDNNPINFNDPSGMAAESADVSGGGVGDPDLKKKVIPVTGFQSSSSQTEPPRTVTQPTEPLALKPAPTSLNTPAPTPDIKINNQQSQASPWSPAGGTAYNAFMSYGGDGSGSIGDDVMWALDKVRDFNMITMANDAVSSWLWGTDSRGIPRSNIDGAHFAVAAMPLFGIEEAISLRFSRSFRGFQKHHIIPNQTYKEFQAELDAIGWSQNSGFNLKKLPAPFHGNHPAYTDFVRGKINGLIRKDGLNLQSMRALQDNLRSTINTIYLDTKAASLNNYFKGIR